MKKKASLILITIVTICVVCIAAFWSNYVMINGEIIDRNAACVQLQGDSLPPASKLERITGLESLDLRAIEISISEYEALSQQFSGCTILWKVPFQDGRYDNTVTEVTVSQMNDRDMEMLRYFPDLRTVDACGCEDYDALTKLREKYPELTVMYTVDVGDAEIRENATECAVTNENVTKVLSMLPYLPDLQMVDGFSCTDYQALMEIREARPDLAVEYAVAIGADSYSWNMNELALDISDAADAMEKLQYFPGLREVAFDGLATDHDLMYELMCRYPEVVIDWQFELYGVATSSTATELILNEIPMESTLTVESALKYFYNLEWVEMCQCGIPSEEMDALWKRHPETRFVWAIPMANSFVRTDVKAFIPFKYGYNIDTPFYDRQAKELKYLVDLECLDLGHMRMTDISFLQYMPKLRYLILADVVCEDFSYMANLTELVYIELFRSYFDDVELLMNMKKLEDLNIGWTNLKNPELLKEMTWLKRLWTNMNGMTRKELEQLRDAMPDTYVYIDSLHPTEGGWRQSYLYYEMRDMLGMFYMK